MSAAYTQPGGQAAGRWLFGPLPDLLLGCGLLYVVVLAAHAVAGPDLRQATPLYLLPLLSLLFSSPHYGATLVRVYEQRRDRRAYALFSVWATLLLGSPEERRHRVTGSAHDHEGREQHRECDAGGHYRLRVPYANRGQPYAVRVGAFYALRCAGERAAVAVEERVVQQGGVVAGPDLCQVAEH